MKFVPIAMLVALLALHTPQLLADGPHLAPYVAEYDVKYGSMSVGTSRTELRRSATPGQWLMESRTTASGLARLMANGTLSQLSTFELEAGGIRPLNYRFDDGTKKTEKDVTLDFDWATGRVKGVAEDEPVDIASESGLQDTASMQAFVLLRLIGGAEPGVIPMIEKDKIKYYRYTLLRRERLKTALGEFDTLVYRSARDGKQRETLLWYAPALGYASVQAEQREDGKRMFQTYIKAYRPGA
jgi:hypothetical protein